MTELNCSEFKIDGKNYLYVYPSKRTTYFKECHTSCLKYQVVLKDQDCELHSDLSLLFNFRIYE